MEQAEGLDQGQPAKTKPVPKVSALEGRERVVYNTHEIEQKRSRFIQ